MTKEKYYAIRIGDPRRHTPYFMLDDRPGVPRLVPRLYVNRETAEAALGDKSNNGSRRVVKVWVHDGSCTGS